MTPADVTGALESWFIRPGVARDLPWRRRRSGWSALVSEAMLQQTQVSRVVPAFERFMTSFPNPADLAAADEETVLAHWSGLGYYRRARLLHAAARVIVEQHGGEVPDDRAALLALPGVGRYTAGAVASIAFGRCEAIVDGNVHRVIARLDDDDRPKDDSAAMARTWSRAEELAQAAHRPGVFNEALMELGATVCTPVSPDCGRCPLSASCGARAAGRVAEVPRPKSPPKRRALHLSVVVVQRGERVLVEPRPAGGLWGGLWQPPTVESQTPLDPDAVEARLPVRLATPVESCGSFIHRTTHREVHIDVGVARSRARRGRWVTVEELDGIPIGNAHRRAFRLAFEDRAAVTGD